MEKSRTQVINETAINRYVELRDKISSAIVAGKKLLGSDSLSAEKVADISAKLSELIETRDSINARLKNDKAINKRDNSIIERREVLDNTVAKKIYDFNNVRMDKKDTKMDNFSDLSSSIASMREGKMKHSISKYVNSRLKQLQEKNAGILTSQTKIVDRNARKGCNKIFQSVKYQADIISTEKRIADIKTERDNNRAVVEGLSNAGFTEKLHTIPVMAKNIGLNARIATLRTKTGILNESHKLADKLKMAKDNLKERWNTSALKERLSHMKNFKQGLINGWNEFKATMRETPTLETAPAR